MGKLKVIFVLFSALLFSMTANALEVKFYPPKHLYLNAANPGRGTYDVIAHLISVKNDSNEKITLEGLDLQLLAEQRIFQEVHLEAGALVKAARELAGMKQQGMQFMVDVMVPPEVLGNNGKLSSAAELQPGEVLVAQNVYLTVQKIPKTMRAIARARNATGAPFQTSSDIPIIQYQSQNKYIYPLKGVWYMQSVPNITSHHRWMFQTEFGIDFLKLDDRGSPYKTDGKSAADYYAFGEPVWAAAEGVVTMVINDVAQNWDAWLQRDGESEDQFQERSEKYHLEGMKKDLYRAVTGNLVVIEHTGGEYSGYAHLKQGSVRVKVGDAVKQGQQIAEVGDTGDYYMAHLHFQISDRPDVIKGRSLPFEFVNLKPGAELGHFARIKN